jgi:MFS superfamily sulfate permease-like transporter
VNHPAPHTAPAADKPATWTDDLLASVVVFLVALPLCLGIALASGADPVAGLLTGIIGGVIVGAISGSPLQVSGPAAGLVTIVAGFISGGSLGLEPTADNPRPGLVLLGVIIVLAGGFQVLAGLLRLGQWFRAVSPAVVHGLLAGIGVLIFVGQLQVMIDDRPHHEGWQNVFDIPQVIRVGLGLESSPGGTDGQLAFWIGIATLGVALLWKPLAPRSLRLVPSALVGILVATGIAALLEARVHHVNVPASLVEGIRLPTLAAWSEAFSYPVLVAALTIALVASAETLLCAGAVDQMHSGPRTRYDQELVAQGVGNVLCGLVGGLPMTGVIVRSAANVEAGGRTRLSAILHGVWLLALVALLPGLLRMIPTAALAAILVLTGYKLMHPRTVFELSRFGKGEVIVYLGTMLTIVFTDLLQGVAVGMALAMLKLLWTFSHLAIRTEHVDGRTILHLEGAATFIRLPKLAAALEAVPANTELHVHLEELTYIDHACLELLINWEKQHETTGGSLVVDWDTLTARFR